jgi:hypothetical protein
VAERDWVRVVAEERCDECGFAAVDIPRSDLGGAFVAEAHNWSAILVDQDEGALRRRPTEERWSALEYACHVRDVLAVFTRRVDQAVVEDQPEFGWWDHEAAVADERYNEQSPAEVAAAIESNARRFAARLAALDGAAWPRVGTRRNSERFTVEGLTYFALHESRHHRNDARLGLG